MIQVEVQQANTQETAHRTQRRAIQGQRRLQRFEAQFGSDALKSLSFLIVGRGECLIDTADANATQLSKGGTFSPLLLLAPV